MFWSGNFIALRELNFLLKEENVTLTQVLEADDILQECKADNKALMQFLTRPDILSELITLITEEPPKSVEISQQYRHASIACEVLTSSLSMLSERLSLDTTQMNRLCDFVSRDPPLNPLLASYFSKTVEMLLERSPKQDWYLYHIVCLRVLDFFKSRRDFLPNLLRHMSTSAIADTFKFFIRLDDLFNKIIMEWLDEHQFLECVVSITCGGAGDCAGDAEKGTREPAEKELGGRDGDAGDEGPEGRARARLRDAAAGNAGALLCELAATGCAADAGGAASRTAAALAGRLASEPGVRAVLAAMFTCPPRARAAALVHGCRLLLALLRRPAAGAPDAAPAGERSAVELAVAPHLPLLHQALLQPPRAAEAAVGEARLQVAALLAALAASEVEEVASTMLTLGTAGVLLDMFFRYSNNNFLHAHVANFCYRACRNPVYRNTYATHLLVECDLLTRLMDAFEENEDTERAAWRAGYMGHAVQMLAQAAAALDAGLEALPAPLAARLERFRRLRLEPALALRDTPLGGSYPSENIYEADNIADALAANYDLSYAMATGDMDDAGDDNELEGGATDIHTDSPQFVADGLGLDGDDKRAQEESDFLELVGQRFAGDDMWDDADEADEFSAPPEAVREVLGEGSPWESEVVSDESSPGEGWAQFNADANADANADTNADTNADANANATADKFATFPDFKYWPYNARAEGGEAADDETAASLASHLLTAMSAMSPAAVANIVNANLQPLALAPRFRPPPPATQVSPASGSPGEVRNEAAESPGSDPTSDAIVMENTDSPAQEKSPTLNDAESDSPTKEANITADKIDDTPAKDDNNELANRDIDTLGNDADNKPTKGAVDTPTEEKSDTPMEETVRSSPTKDCQETMLSDSTIESSNSPTRSDADCIPSDVTGTEIDDPSER